MQILLQCFAERLDWYNYGISSVNRTATFIACSIIARLLLQVYLNDLDFLSL